MRTFRATLFLSGLCALSACGGGGSDGVLPLSYAEGSAAALALFDEVAALPGTVALPTSGTARYEGFAQIDPDDGVDRILLSRLQIDLDFRTAAIDGELDNFVWQDEERVSGEVDISNGAITGTQLEFDLNGILEDSVGRATIAARATAVFQGEEADGLLGGANGTFAREGAAPVAIDSSFVAARVP